MMTHEAQEVVMSQLERIAVALTRMAKGMERAVAGLGPEPQPADPVQLSAPASRAMNLMADELLQLLAGPPTEAELDLVLEAVGAPEPDDVTQALRALTRHRREAALMALLERGVEVER